MEVLAQGPVSHGVQLYDDLPYLAARVGAFLVEGLRRGGAAIVVARPAHLAAISADLVSRGVDAAALVAVGSLVMLDAEATLRTLSVDGIPDRTRFRSMIGDVLARARAGTDRTVRVYGEMVDVLWSDGHAAATHALEEMWNELLGEGPLELLCGYRLSGFAEGHHVHAFEQVCAAHGTVAAPERLAALDLTPEAQRTAALIEQRSRALETEIARRVRLEDRLAQLLAVSEALATCVSREEVADVAIERGIPAVGASHGGFWQLDAAGTTLELLALSTQLAGSAERWSRLPATADTPLGSVALTGVPMFIESIDDYQARYPESFERLRSAIPCPALAYATMPLGAAGARLGAMALIYEDARRISEADRTLLELLARQCEQALERVRLLEIDRAARDRQEADARTREQVLSTVSDDLRKALGSIMMGAGALLQVANPLVPVAARNESRLGRVQTVAGRIGRQAERTTRLIEDLVDFASIQVGVLVLNRTPQEPQALITRTRDMFSRAATEHGLVLEAAETQLPLVECDAERVVQILGILVSNAIKVTERGGTVSIGARATDGYTVFFVRDTGPGIHPDELPGLFDPYWRNRHSSEGAGLGLAIARELVEAHGGRLWVRSELGAGSTFFFSLTSNVN